MYQKSLHLLTCALLPLFHGQVPHELVGVREEEIPGPGEEGGKVFQESLGCGRTAFACWKYQ